MDELLFRVAKERVFWRPGKGKKIAPSSSKYEYFKNIVRTVHIEDAVHICMQHRMSARPIVNTSVLSKNRLSNEHPCKNMQVIWFCVQSQPQVHDSYGNVQFAFPADMLRRCWKYCYLVELRTTEEDTTTRLLITNKDYSKILQEYDPCQLGGPWCIRAEGDFVLVDSKRFNDEGSNKNGHTLEFMIEATPEEQQNILQECEISFKDHSQACSIVRSKKCRRIFSKAKCHLPLPMTAAARLFFDLHQRIADTHPIASPRLSNSAEKLRQSHVSMNKRLGRLWIPVLPAYRPQP